MLYGHMGHSEEAFDHAEEKGRGAYSRSTVRGSAAGPGSQAGPSAPLIGSGSTLPSGGSSVGLTPKTVRNIGWRYAQAGLWRALYDRPRPGAPPLLTVTQKQQIIAMVCSDAPEGRARWTIRLIAEESIRRKLVPTVGRETIRLLLQSHDSKPWRIKSWCVAELTPEYIRKME